MILTTLEIACDHERAGRPCDQAYNAGRGVDRAELSRAAKVNGWEFVRDGLAEIHLCPRHARIVSP